MISVLFYNAFNKVHLETIRVIIILIISMDEHNNYDYIVHNKYSKLALVRKQNGSSN